MLLDKTAPGRHRPKRRRAAALQGVDHFFRAFLKFVGLITMKRCPTCNQTFSDEWLTFCTVDGSPLIETGTLPQSLPTVVMPQTDEARETSVEQPRPTFSSADSRSPLQNIPSWQPPPPPAMMAGPSQGLAVSSMVLGLVS